MKLMKRITILIILLDLLGCTSLERRSVSSTEPTVISQIVQDCFTDSFYISNSETQLVLCRVKDGRVYYVPELKIISPRITLVQSDYIEDLDPHNPNILNFSILNFKIIETNKSKKSFNVVKLKYPQAINLSESKDAILMLNIPAKAGESARKIKLPFNANDFEVILSETDTNLVLGGGIDLLAPKYIYNKENHFIVGLEAEKLNLNERYEKGFEVFNSPYSKTVFENFLNYRKSYFETQASAVKKRDQIQLLNRLLQFIHSET